jgi:hypothetical protein
MTTEIKIVVIKSLYQNSHTWHVDLANGDAFSFRLEPRRDNHSLAWYKTKDEAIKAAKKAIGFIKKARIVT